VTRFDKLQLAEAPFNSIAYNSDRQTFVVIAPSLFSVVIEDPFLFLKTQFQSYVAFIFL